MGKMLTILLAAVLGVVAPAKGAIITQYAPEQLESDMALSVQITNNDDGAIYNSYDLGLFYSLALSLYNLPQNQSNYSSVDDLVGDWSFGILSGEVDNKWAAGLGSVNPIPITHSGLGYDQWFATQQNSNQDTMDARLRIPTSQLDGNGNGWSASDPGDYSIEMNSTPTADMGIGIAGLDSWSAQGYEYGVALNGDGKIVQYAPDYDNYGSTVGLVVDLTNNDNGAVYNSYDLSLFSSLATALYALPQNQTNYASADALMGDWILQIVGDPAGEVNAGWSTSGGYDPVEISNVGGIPGLDYEQWLATPQNPNQDMMRLLLEIPKAQLDGNGNGWSASDPGDYSIEMNSTPTADMGIGIAGLDSWSAQGYEYGVALNGGSEPVAGRFEMVTMELGLPALTITNSPNTMTVIVQRCDGGLMNGDWQTITNLVPGTTQWTDETATGAWEQLYYRLAK